MEEINHLMFIIRQCHHHRIKSDLKMERIHLHPSGKNTVLPIGHLDFLKVLAILDLLNHMTCISLHQDPIVSQTCPYGEKLSQNFLLQRLLTMQSHLPITSMHPTCLVRRSKEERVPLLPLKSSLLTEKK